MLFPNELRFKVNAQQSFPGQLDEAMFRLMIVNQLSEDWQSAIVIVFFIFLLP